MTKVSIKTIEEFIEYVCKLNNPNKIRRQLQRILNI